MIGRYLEHWQAKQALNFYAAPLDWTDPVHLGGARRIYRIEETDEGYRLVAYAENELA